MAYQLGQSSLLPSRPPPPAPQRRPELSVYGSGSLTSVSTASVGTQNSAFTSNYGSGPPSPSMSQYHSTYSGIGGSPNRNPNPIRSAQDVIRYGWAQVKDDGFAGFLNTWSKKYLVLREQSLAIQKNEVRGSGVTCRTFVDIDPS